MVLVNDEDGFAGPLLTQLVVDVILGPIVLLLESQAAHIHALYFPCCLESGFAAWPSWSLLWIEHLCSWLDVDPNPTPMLASLCPEISPWEITGCGPTIAQCRREC